MLDVNKITMLEKKTLIIAELSANHGGSYETAAATIRAAAAAGADAVKLQTYTPELITLDCDDAPFRIGHGTLWDGRTLYDLYREAHTPREWHEGLMEVARGEGLICFSSPFDATAVDFLERLDVPAYKIASFEITDIPLIEHAASKGKPMLISTGIATLDEIAAAVDACRRTGNERVTLLQCTSAYPARAEEANLLTIPDLRARFGTAVGLSDHTPGHTVAVAAVALGAQVIEKHLILSRSQGGPDAAFSMEPDEFRAMVAAVRETEAALGEATYELSEQAAANRRFARSLFVVEDIARGEPITEKNVRSIRPSDGLPPKYLPLLLGQRASRDLKRGTPLKASDVEE
jgi:pseudaminic acid synthase